LSEDRFEVIRINYSVASIPPFRIDIPLSSESIQFSVKMTRTEPDDKVELEEVLRLLHLPLGQHLGSRKILKIFMIHNNIDGISWTFQVIFPNLESFENSKQFLFMCVIVQLHHGESVKVKDHWMNFILFVNNRKDCSKSMVQSISFHNKLSIRNPISENGNRGKCLLERVESITTGRVKLPRDILLGETYQWNDNVQVVKDEPAIEISKT